MRIDPELGAVLLALAAGGGLTFVSRRRRICEICGRRLRSVLCACEEAAAEALDAVEERIPARRSK